MANAGPPGGRAAGVRRRCGAVTRVDLATVFLAAMLCSASYLLGIWHNNRGAADGARILGPSAALAGAASCGGDDEPLDFEARHSAEGAGLSVSASPSTTTTTTRRALRGAVPGSTWYAFAVGTAGGSSAGAVAGGSRRFVDAASAVRRA